MAFLALYDTSPTDAGKNSSAAAVPARYARTRNAAPGGEDSTMSNLDSAHSNDIATASEGVDQLLREIVQRDQEEGRKTLAQRQREMQRRMREQQLSRRGLPSERGKAILEAASRCSFEELVDTLTSTASADEEAARAAWAIAILVSRDHALLSELEQHIVESDLSTDQRGRLLKLLCVVPGDDVGALLARLGASVSGRLLEVAIDTLSTWSRLDPSYPPCDQVLWLESVDVCPSTPFPKIRFSVWDISNPLAINAFLQLGKRDDLDEAAQRALADAMGWQVRRLTGPEALVRNLPRTCLEYVREMTQYMVKYYQSAETVKEQLWRLALFRVSPLPEVTQLYVSLLSHPDTLLRRSAIAGLENQGNMLAKVEDRIFQLAQTENCFLVKLDALDALTSSGRYGSEKVRILVELYGLQEDEANRLAVVRSLGYCNADAVVHLERIALTEPSPRIREEALNRAEKLRQQVKSGNPDLPE
jgi:hypothetical protein